MGTTIRLLTAFLLIALPAIGRAQVTIVPASPVAFEPVVARVTADLCSISQDVFGVAYSAGTIRLTTYAIGCTEPGVRKAIDFRLGSLPPGRYTIESSHIVEGTSFVLFPATTLTVRESIVDTVSTPPRRPTADYAGVWWVPSESGWGLAIQQTPGDTLFAQLYVYDAGSQARWYTFQGGAWKSTTRWEGTVYATTGPGFAGATFDPSRVTVTASGTASLEFAQSPGSEGIGTLSYTVGGATVTKRIRRMAF